MKLEARHGEGAVADPLAKPNAAREARSGNTTRTPEIEHEGTRSYRLRDRASSVYEGTTRTTRAPSGVTLRIWPRG
jgi:hypothetical protein